MVMNSRASRGIRSRLAEDAYSKRFRVSGKVLFAPSRTRSEMPRADCPLHLTLQTNRLSRFLFYFFSIAAASGKLGKVVPGIRKYITPLNGVPLNSTHPFWPTRPKIKQVLPLFCFALCAKISQLAFCKQTVKR